MLARHTSFLGLTAVLAAATVHVPPPFAPPPTVSAAISLTEALVAIASDYDGAGGGAVRFNFGASNVLARQIVSGARVDLFISADEAQMDIVDRAGLIAKGSRVDLIRNQLAVVVPDDRRRTLTGIRDLLDPSFKRIAIGDPASVPAGVYAKAYLEGAGLWGSLQPRLVPSASVRAALKAVEAGAADAAIVYRSDARISSRAVEAWLIPLDKGPRIVYPAAVIDGAASAVDARRFLDFLRTVNSARTFQRFGFLAMDDPR